MLVTGAKEKGGGAQVKSRKGTDGHQVLCCQDPHQAFLVFEIPALFFKRMEVIQEAGTKLMKIKTHFSPSSPVITRWQQVQAIWDEADTVCQDWIFLFRKEKDQGTVVAPNPWCLSSSTGAIMNKWQSKLPVQRPLKVGRVAEGQG